MKVIYISLFASIAILAFGMGWFAKSRLGNTEISKIPETVVNREKPLGKYSFDSLSQKQVPAGKITIGSTLKDETDFTSKVFTLEFDPTISGHENKKVTGVMNIPKNITSNRLPLIVMFRGYVDQKMYFAGEGTKNASEFFVKNGYITIAPDFLGYAGSDSESANIFESRFQTYTTALTTLASVDQIPSWDKKNIFIWGHSNGGQVALTTLELSHKNIPTVLWAPVSKPFPYSILYYTDDSDDHGKLIRGELAKFEEDYDVEKYSLTNYLDKIQAPLQIHQGTADDAVPLAWTNLLVKNLKTLDKTVDYFTYPDANHNLQPAWNTVVQRNLDFFQKHLER